MSVIHRYIGVDVAKGWIDVFDPETGCRRISCQAGCLTAFARESRGALVVLEASGGYERRLMAALRQAGQPFHRVNPRHARAFATATGRLAKTDRVDARMLSEMGRALALSAQDAPDPACQHLADLMGRLDDLKGHRQAERTRLHQAQGKFIREDIAGMIAVLDRRIAACEARITQQIAANPSQQTRYRRLQTMPGIGPTIAAQLLARLPELGRLDRRAVASLAGLAPVARDSGTRRGKRHIGAGRRSVTRALYQAGLVASRWDPGMKAYRARLQANGKPAKSPSSQQPERSSLSSTK